MKICLASLFTSDLAKVLLGAGLTVVTGTIVGAIAKFIVDPLNDYKTLRSKIAEELMFYANVYSNPFRRVEQGVPPRYVECQDGLRRLAASFQARYTSIPLRNFWIEFGQIPSENDAIEIRRGLIGLSNSLYGPSVDVLENVRDGERIHKLLGLEQEIKAAHE